MIIAIGSSRNSSMLREKWQLPVSKKSFLIKNLFRDEPVNFHAGFDCVINEPIPEGTPPVDQSVFPFLHPLHQSLLLRVVVPLGAGE